MLGTLVMVALQILLTYAPAMNKLFHTRPINFESWIRIAAVVALTFVAVEFEKWLRFGRWRSQNMPK